MRITIEIDTRDELDARDQAVLAAVTGGVAAPAATAAPAAAAAKAEPKAAAAKAEKPAAAAEPAAAPADAEDPVVKEAVAKATALMKAGNAARVKEILAEIGAEKVSKLSTEQAQQFLDLESV